MKTKNKVLIMSCLSVVIGLTGCQKEDAKDRAEKKIDTATDMAKEDIEQSNKAADKRIEGMKDSLDERAKQAKENVEQSTEASKEALENVKDNVDQNADIAEKKVEQVKDNAEKKLDAMKDSPTTVLPAVTGEQMDDSMITVKVKDAIMADAMLSNSHINVDTVNSVVKLSGTVDSEKSIARAVAAANSQKGVTAVQNDLTVDVKGK